MASYVTITLDTTGPASATMTIDGGAQFCTNQLVTVALSSPATDELQMKIWGNVDTTYNANIQATEGASNWITYQESIQAMLSAGDGAKTLYGKIRDDVYNESAQVSDTITLDTTIPAAAIAGPDVNKISKITGKNTAAFSFQADQDFTEYKVKVVGSTGAAHDTGTVIPTTAGSTNTSGTGTWTTASVINVTINGTDLETASSGDGAKIVKVFIKDGAGNWSV